MSLAGTTTALAEPLTTFGVLFPAATGEVGQFGTALPDVDLAVQADLPENVQGVVARTVRQDFDEAIRQVADTSLTDLLMAGWHQQVELRAAGRRTADQPGRKETVTLGTHKIIHRMRPAIAIEVDKREILRIVVIVAVEAKVEALCVRVAFGRAWEVLSGSATFTAKLTVGTAPALTRSTKVDLPGVLRMEDGLALV